MCLWNEQIESECWHNKSLLPNAGMMDYIDLTLAAWSIVHSCNLSTFSSSVDNNVDGCLIFNMQEGGNVAAGPPEPKLFPLPVLLLSRQDVLSHLATQLPLNSYQGSFLSKHTHKHGGQVHMCTFEIGQTGRWKRIGSPPQTQTLFIDPMRPRSTRHQHRHISEFVSGSFFFFRRLWWGAVYPQPVPGRDESFQASRVDCVTVGDCHVAIASCHLRPAAHSRLLLLCKADM